MNSGRLGEVELVPGARVPVQSSVRFTRAQRCEVAKIQDGQGQPETSHNSHTMQYMEMKTNESLWQNLQKPMKTHENA